VWFQAFCGQPDLGVQIATEGILDGIRPADEMQARLGVPVELENDANVDMRQDLGMAERGSSHRIVVVGGGFGGLQACLKLARMPVEVTLVDRRNFHFFQPLAYQVATGAVSPAEICYPLRRIFRRRRNVTVVLAEVVDVDFAARRVELRDCALGTAPEALEYDTLIVSGGSEYSYFGHDEWREYAAELKSLEGALSIRRRILEAFEAAELEPDPEVRAVLLTFVVVGAGPTGVEMAGQIAEIARDERGFRNYDPGSARILIIEALDRILTSFPESLSAKALRGLESLGVTGRIGESVIDVDADSVTVRRADDSTERIATRTVIWAAGVNASPLARILAERADLEVDRAGRLEVLGDLSVEGHPEVLALGDMVTVRQPDGTALVLPGVAPVAMQQGRYAARAIRDRLASREPKPFRYIDKGNLATIGRARAVADVKGLHLSGFIAWVTWLVIHLWYLIGFQNRVLVVIRWAFSFFTRGRGARLITH
jgi:NADH:ubiquinone reductase (H+-translocating)